MARTVALLLLTVTIFYCFSFSRAEEESNQNPDNVESPIHPLLDPETANVLREIRPDIRPRFLLPGWKPWIPIRLPTTTTTTPPTTAAG